MDGFEFNKIAGAVLATALGVMGLRLIGDFIYEPIEAEEPGYVIAVATPGETTGPAVAEVEPIAVRMQVATADDGEKVSRKCASCHNFAEGAPAKVGPTLWGVLGRPVASSADYDKYSNTMKEHGAEGRTWTYEELDHFLANPKGWVPGTSMGFAGLKKPEDRAEMIAYLRSLSNDPLPLPVVAAAAPADEAAGSPADSEGATDAPAADAPSDETGGGSETSPAN